jgi:hypothetical protein
MIYSIWHSSPPTFILRPGPNLPNLGFARNNPQAKRSRFRKDRIRSWHCRWEDLRVALRPSAIRKRQSPCSGIWRVYGMPTSCPVTRVIFTDTFSSDEVGLRTFIRSSIATNKPTHPWKRCSAISRILWVADRAIAMTSVLL